MSRMITLTNVYRTYKTKRGKIDALSDINLAIDAGEFVVIQGPSGSGKTTLLWILGAMLRPSSGRVLIDDRDLYRLGIAERNRFRAQEVGFVFQASHLLAYLSLRENVRLGQLNQANPDATDRLLARLGLAERAEHRPGELSVGEQQRAALARALIKGPKLILADEPTGNLDPRNATEVLNILVEYHHEGGTVFLVTHGRDTQNLPGRTIQLHAGRLVEV
ncbi:MAG: ABC transporter ATP-binding protein [Pirellulales bacterium]|nr:ABC transporter ATP-binding protein [Pirellulales bacterium]